MCRCGAYSRRRLLKKLTERNKNYFKNSNIFFLLLVHLYTNQQKVKFTLSNKVYIIVGLNITVNYLHAWHDYLLYIEIVWSKRINSNLRQNTCMGLSISRPFSYGCSSYYIPGRRLFEGGTYLNF